PGRAGRDRRQAPARPGSCFSFYPAFASWMAAHTRAGVTGMSMLRTLYGKSASMTAFTYAAGEPTVADSPTPLAPIGWCGDGVTVLPSSQDGHSTAVGSR